MLQSYREGRDQKLKCVAQPYKMKVLRKVGGSHVEEGDFCEIPIGRDDTGRAGYGICIGMGYTGGKFMKIGG